MKKKDCLTWAEALINGEFEKLRGAMSDAEVESNKPTACCCLGVANEVLLKDSLCDRLSNVAYSLSAKGVFKSGANPRIFGIEASVINDGDYHHDCPVGDEGLTHEQIGILLLLAIETGEYKNI
jgi:hypothetical protein